MVSCKGSIKRSIKLTFNGINAVLFRFSDLIDYNHIAIIENHDVSVKVVVMLKFTQLPRPNQKLCLGNNDNKYCDMHVFNQWLLQFS